MKFVTCFPAALAAKLLFGSRSNQNLQRSSCKPVCHTAVCRAKQFGTTPGEMKVHGIYSTVAGDFCVNEVLQIYLVIVIGLTNVILELSLFFFLYC